MPHVENRIRRELRRLSVPVDGSRAFERVDHRRRRLRTVRRIRVVVLVVVVIAGAVGAGVGLASVLDLDGRSRVAQEPHPARELAELCGASSATSDVDGDGAEDRIEVGVPLPPSEAACGDVRLERYVARIVLATGTDGARTYEQPLPECEVTSVCWVLATPDLDGDGRDEPAIVVSVGVSTINLALYRFDEEARDAPFRRLVVAEPGDPFDETFGIGPGPATFSWFGSVTHQHWLTCEGGDDRFTVVTVLRTDEPGVDLVHRTVFRIEGTALVVDETLDERVPEASLTPPPDLCGSPMNARPEIP